MGIRSSTVSLGSNQVSTGSQRLKPATTSSSETTIVTRPSLTANTSSASLPTETQGNNSSAPGSYAKSQSRKKSIIIGAVLGSVTLFALFAILVLRRSKWVAQVGYFSKEDRGTSRSENPGISLETGQPDQGISPVPSATQLDPRQEVKGMTEPEPQPTVQPSHSRPNTTCTISDNVHQSTPVPARMLTLEELMVSSSTPLVELQRMRLEIQGFQDQDQVDLETESKDDEPPAYSYEHLKMPMSGITRGRDRGIPSGMPYTPSEGIPEAFPDHGAAM
ncbi:hypothetical protein C8J56DRAFT_1172746 [Mycena floridula]|nr:hypothetical protein C8J56DRAFT_1172746 [Mycena floridula]